MANLKTSKKDISRNKRNRARNLHFITRMKSQIKKAITAIETNDKEKEAIVQATCRVIDKTSAKGIIKKKVGARKKSRLMGALNRGTTVVPETPKKTKKATKAAKPSPKKEVKKPATKAKAKTAKPKATAKKEAKPETESKAKD